MSNRQVKEKLQIELRELTLKINKLQLEVMKHYEKLLISRIANLEDLVQNEM